MCESPTEFCAFSNGNRGASVPLMILAPFPSHPAAQLTICQVTINKRSAKLCYPKNAVGFLTTRSGEPPSS